MTAVADNQEVANERAVLHVRKGFWSGIGKSFRGSITDYARTIWLGAGYLGEWAKTNLCRNCRAKGGIETCRHFEIDTARQLCGPFQAIEDPNVRIVMILKAAQTAGSTVWDLTVHWLLVHSHYLRIKVLMDSDDKAKEYCLQKLMDTLKANPDIAQFLPTGADRFGVTSTELRLLNGKTLFVGGLNDSNASSLPADVMILDEGWLHQADGLMKKAFDRLKQTKTGKIIVVGQAGDVDEDQDKIWKALHQRVPLTWACPCCGGRQQFELNKLRPADFAAREPVHFSGERPATPLAGSYVGFKIGKRISELNTPDEIKAACAKATVECYFCGHEIADTWENRRTLNASFEQNYRKQLPDGSFYTPPNYSVGFWNPDPASMFVSFAYTMEEFVKAKKAKDNLGSETLLRDFYRGNWATPWDAALIKTIRARTQQHYDQQSDWPEEWRGRRVLIVDCQQELQYFWGSVWAISRTGKSRQLWRGILRGFGVAAKGFKEQPETIAGKQKEFGVRDPFVFLDGAYMREDLIEECAKHGSWAVAEDGERDWYCWTLLVGADAPNGFSHKADKNRNLRHPVSDPFYESPKMTIDGYRTSVEIFYFSTLKMGDMFARYRDGNGPETLFLPETEDLENKLAWTAQINACSKVTTLGRKDGAPIEIWKPPTQNTPHHYWDIGRMFMAVHVLWGISGDQQYEIPAAEVSAAKPE